MKNILFLLAAVFGLVAAASLLGFAKNLDETRSYNAHIEKRISDYFQYLSADEQTALRGIRPDTDPVLAAMIHPKRPLADVKDDGKRKVWQVLRLSGLKPGQTVFELEAGKGYYTELFSRIVGAHGQVIMQNPQEFADFVTPEVLNARLGEKGQRLSNVRVSETPFDNLQAGDGSADLVTWFLGPHELWLPNAQGELTMGNPEKTYKEIYRILKPGGTFMVIDTIAKPGVSERDGGATHSINPEFVKARALASGLVLAGTSDILSAKAGRSSSDEGIPLKMDAGVKRASTQRFIHLYTKPVLRK